MKVFEGEDLEDFQKTEDWDLGPGTRPGEPYSSIASDPHPRWVWVTTTWIPETEPGTQVPM